MTSLFITALSAENVPDRLAQEEEEEEEGEGCVMGRGRGKPHV